MRVVLVRHAQTVENADQIVQGHIPGRLSTQGKHQAGAVARRLREERFDAVYASDLSRAVETALILTKGRRRPPVVQDPRLREQNFGLYEGKPVRTLLADMKRVQAGFREFTPEGGESYSALYRRVSEFWRDIRAKHQRQNLLVVTHYGVINVLLDIAVGDTAGIWQDVMGNTAVTVLTVNGSAAAQSEVINCTEHLS